MAAKAAKAAKAALLAAEAALGAKARPAARAPKACSADDQAAAKVDGAARVASAAAAAETVGPAVCYRLPTRSLDRATASYSDRTHRPSAARAERGAKNADANATFLAKYNTT